MPDAQICEIDLPTADQIPLSWVARQSNRLRYEAVVDEMGSDDMFVPVHVLVPGYRLQVDHETFSLAAVTGVDVDALPRGRAGLPLLSWDERESGPEGQVLAVANVGGGVTENTHLADIGVTVALDHRRQGLGRRIHRACLDIAESRGRHTAVVWTSHPEAAEGEPLVDVRGGSARIAATGSAAAFALSEGYHVEQVELHSVLQLTDLTDWDALAVAARAKAPGYELVTFAGATPDTWAAGYADLFSHFSTQIPTGGLEVDPETWDVERLRRQESVRQARGDLTVTTLAVETATNRVVGATDLTTNVGLPEVLWQQNTIVHADHRGHALGLLLKIANIRAGQEAQPLARRMHTWNAQENTHMLAINRLLGYAAPMIEAAWQRRGPEARG